MLSAKPVALIAAAFAQAGGALVSQTEGLSHFVTGGLSIGSLVTAIGSIYVMREKVRRNETDIESHKRDTKGALKEVTEGFTESLRQMHADHREDQRETREALSTMTVSIGDIKALVEKRAAATRRSD